MSKAREDTNQIIQKSMSIDKILDFKNTETEIFRDILRFLSPKIKQLIRNYEKKDNETGQINSLQDINLLFNAIEEIDDPTCFRIRDLVNWLLENNLKFRDEYWRSPINKSNRAHTKTPFVEARINKLIEMNLLIKSQDKVKSKRNSEISTYLYRVTPRGVRAALTVDIRNCNKDSNEYKSNLKLLLNEWLDCIPAGYTDPYNYHYHFIAALLEECLNAYDDIILSFIDIIKEYPNDSLINFANIRSSINALFFRKMTNDPKFKLMFFTVMNELNISKRLKVPEISDRQDELLSQKEQFLKIQFKLDVENYMDRIITENLILPAHQIREIYRRKQQQNSGKTRLEILSQIQPNRFQEQILDFRLKMLWDHERNENLLNSNKITLMASCKKCFQTFPFLFEFEKEIFDDIECRSCNATNLSILE